MAHIENDVLWVEEGIEFSQNYMRKPSQFGSVAGGVHNRMQKRIRYMKSVRFSTFDASRKLVKCDNLVRTYMVDHRRHQLELWKEAKQKKKKEDSVKKPKPFLVGVPHAPLQYVPPPLSPRPSTSGRKIPSQAGCTLTGVKLMETKAASVSFAPQNATFKPPVLKTLAKLPKLSSTKASKYNIIFEPVLPSTQKASIQQDNEFFLVGMPHAPLQYVPPPLSPRPSTSGRKTPSQAGCTPTGVQPIETKAASVSIAPKNATFKPPVLKTLAKLPKLASTKARKYNITLEPALPSTHKASIQQDNEFLPILTSENLIKSVAPLNSPKITSEKSRKSTQNITPNKSHILLPQSESSSAEHLRSPKNLDDDLALTTEQLVEADKNSSFVTMSRGSNNARKEMKQTRDEGLLDEGSRINVDHFRRQLAAEMKRMTEMCDTWEKIIEQDVLPESILEAGLTAVGQARLLLSHKMQQFKSLVEQYGRPEPGAVLITVADLHGFWDLLFIQIENVCMNFMKLEELRLCGWVEEVQPVEVKKKVVRPTVHVKKAAKPTCRTSRLRETIADARKAMKEQEEAPVTLQSPVGDSKTFEAGFSNVSSPACSKSSLVKDVLTPSSANKHTTITQTSLYATGPSIRIMQNTNTDNKSGRIFDQSDEDVLLVGVSCQTKASGEIQEQKIEEIQTADSGISSMDHEKVEKEENYKRTPKLLRQDAVERMMVTRSQNKSETMNKTHGDDYDAVTPRRSSRKKVLRESEDNVAEETTKG